MRAPTLKAHSCHLIQEAKVQLETQDKREERKLQLEDCALQVSPSGYYLDPELSLEEQREMLEGFFEEISKGRKPTLILRTQLSVRVNAILEKLYGSSGPELRRSLFSLKQIFQEDKDLVPEFVHSEGLSCLTRVGAAADHNYQTYILRALGQLMLFVDGMLGVVAHTETVQWLYTLCASLSRLVVKTALKLLLVFVEYSESNAPLFIRAVNSVASTTGAPPWANLVSILEEKNGTDPELLVYTVTLINKTLAALPDQDSFYDVTDALEQQGMEALIQHHLGKAGTDVDLRAQLVLYENALRLEDGDLEEVVTGGRRTTRRKPSSEEGKRSRRSLEVRSPEPGSTGPASPVVSTSAASLVLPTSSTSRPVGPASPPSPASSPVGPASGLHSTLRLFPSVSVAPSSDSSCERSVYKLHQTAPVWAPESPPVPQVPTGEARLEARFLENVAAAETEKQAALAQGRAETLAGAMPDDMDGCPAPDGPALPTKRKTVKLFWRELKLAGVRGGSGSRFGPSPTLWASLEPVSVDTARLEHLFESRAKDVLPSKKAGEGRRTMTTVLDPKRSNAINIGLTTLPPVHVIKAALLNFDEFAVSKDGIEKLLTMMPTEEERQKIEEAQLANPDVPLGPAENFLMTLASIGGLAARLQLWAFKLDYDSMEREIAEPLFDLKVGMEQLVQNATFRCILATLLAVGNFLNGSQSSGFELSYLEKVSEVKDTVRRQPLLHHLCALVLQARPDSSDLYSEIPALARCAKVDFEQLTENLGQLERRSRAAEDSLRSLAKHDLAPALRARLTHFLVHCTRRVAMLRVVHRRVCNRFHAFLLYLGYTAEAAREVRIMQFCHTLREFALEYRTCRDRVLQQQQKRATYRERNKTRGRMITETEKFSGVAGETPSKPSVPVAVSSGPGEGDADSHATMKSLLASKPEDATHGRRSRGMVQSSSPVMPTAVGPSTVPPEEPPGSSLPSDTSDEIMDLLVQSVTKSSPRALAARERKRSRGNRKSLRRTLKSGLGEDLVQALGLSKGPGLEV
ncbi:FH1/FH2 domain-containing protein 1 isoform X4 [Bubalus kerabau]|uniref:FH1/FH2 domain-containing protein 1 isoform X4 n=1 Tax=Bubalus carabanensis TaxID=3119969 RepID=UPI00244ECE2D|nr:FH1/FH2 domain-containing protein 1 isoform X4 [Bubalus carabanensis]